MAMKDLPKSVAQKIISSHIREGNWQKKGSEIGIKIDQCLTQDSTGTMAWLEFESLNLDKIKCELAVSYCDHTSLAFKSESSDDHAFLRSIANYFGAFYSKAGNGVCHQIHYERFGIPGKTLLGSDSHTPTAGGLGMLAMGAGGMDVAVALAGGLFYLTMPSLAKVNLSGELAWGCDAKDIILELLKRIKVTGGVGKIIEYYGKGVKTLSVTQRATITNMGAETGATTSIFPSDEITRQFLKAQGREADFVELYADEDAQFDEEISINLFNVEPMVAMPGSPDNVKKVSEVAGTKIDQVVIGSCTNGSYREIKIASEILKDRKISNNIDLIVVPGSRQAMLMLIEDGSIDKIVKAGGRIIDSGCGPCIGMGNVPGNGQLSLRTFNRNWQGRGGNKNASLALCSSEIAAVSALSGEITDPRAFKPFRVDEPSSFYIEDSMIIKADPEKKEEIIRSENIVAIKQQVPLSRPAILKGEVLISLGDGISTDDILPAGPLTQHLRSNLPAISNFCFYYQDQNFSKLAKEKQGGFILAGQNYGQGSSREHAALAPKELGVKAVIAKSFARIHRDNLINVGIVPITLKYDDSILAKGDPLEVNLLDFKNIKITNEKTGKTLSAEYDFSDREIDILKAGGILAYSTREGMLEY